METDVGSINLLTSTAVSLFSSLQLSLNKCSLQPSLGDVSEKESTSLVVNNLGTSSPGLFSVPPQSHEEGHKNEGVIWGHELETVGLY